MVATNINVLLEKKGDVDDGVDVDLDVDVDAVVRGRRGGCASDEKSLARLQSLTCVELHIAISVIKQL